MQFERITVETDYACSIKFIKQKIDYIHRNPVVEKIVEHPEDCIFSSARNYAELDSELEIIPVIIF